MTAGGSDYQWVFVNLSASDLSINENFRVGDPSTHSSNTPVGLLKMHDKFFVTGGAILNTAFDSRPSGGIFVFDENNLGQILSTSI